MANDSEQTREESGKSLSTHGELERTESGTRSRWRLVAAPVIMAFVDLVLTLEGQTSEYWAGNRGAVLEANPLARLFLEWHPAALVVAYVPYVALMLILVLWWRPAVGRTWALVFTLAHAFGASTWTLRLPGGILYCVAVWCLARWLYGVGDEV